MIYTRLKIAALVLATISLLCICTTGMADFLEEALVGAWLFHEGSGKVAKDASGNGHDGELHRAYTHGILEGESAAPNPPDQNAESVKIGRWGAPRGDFMIGLIDEAAIFNRALTQEEIGLVITGLAAMLAVESSGKLTVTWGYISNDH